MSIIDLVYRVADFYNLPKDQVTPSKSIDLNQAAQRPPKTGFDLTKARTDLGYAPMKLEQTLGLLSKLD